MNIPKYISLILCLVLAALAGCSSGGGGTPADPNAPAAVALTVSKTTALANNTDAVTVGISVNKGDGNVVADGTDVVCSASGSGKLSANSGKTVNGQVSMTMTRGPVNAGKNEVVTVTCAAGGTSGKKDVKFINQPTSVMVSIALKGAIPNLGALDFKLSNTAGATFDNFGQPIVAVNGAAGSTVAANFDPALNTTTISMINANGFNTGTTPMMNLTFGIVAGAMPTFSIDATAGGVTATDNNSVAITPAMTPVGMAVTTLLDTE